MAGAPKSLPSLTYTALGGSPGSNGAELGKGAFGVVTTATLVTDGGARQVAVKRMPPRVTTALAAAGVELPSWQHELDILARVGMHENVVEVMGVCTDAPDGDTRVRAPPILCTDWKWSCVPPGAPPVAFPSALCDG